MIDCFDDDCLDRPLAITRGCVGSGRRGDTGGFRSRSNTCKVRTYKCIRQEDLGLGGTMAKAYDIGIYSNHN